MEKSKYFTNILHEDEQYNTTLTDDVETNKYELITNQVVNNRLIKTNKESKSSLFKNSRLMWMSMSIRCYIITLDM